MDGEAAIHIKDSEVLRICLDIWDTDKDGFITEDEAATQKLISHLTFSENANIISFDEFKYFNFISSSNSLFLGCTSLRSIELPINENIRYKYFYGCSSLERCIVGNKCTTIGKQAFHQCISLKKISIPDSVISIEGNAFNGTSLHEFVYPSGITVVDGLAENPNLAFIEIKGKNVVSVSGMNLCPALDTLIINSEIPPTTDYWTLRDSKIPNIYVPDTSVNVYKTSNGWSKWATYIKPMSERP